LPKAKGYLQSLLDAGEANFLISNEVVVLNRFNDRSSGNLSAIFDIRSESSDVEKKKVAKSPEFSLQKKLSTESELIDP